MVKNGEVERKNARFHPNKNIITRALGATESVSADFFEVSLNESIVVLCSDGLSNMMDDDEIMRTVLENEDNFEDAGRSLVQKANEYGGKDNISVIIVTP
jgi:protein phosphatase